MADLDAIAKRAEAATRGPWVVEDLPKPYPQRITNAAAIIVACTYTGPEFPPADAEFIAHARTDVPELVAEVRALRVELERIRAEVPALCEQIEDEVNGAFRETGPGLDLGAIRNAVKARPAESVQEVQK